VSPSVRPGSYLSIVVQKKQPRPEQIFVGSENIARWIDAYAVVRICSCDRLFGSSETCRGRSELERANDDQNRPIVPQILCPWPAALSLILIQDALFGRLQHSTRHFVIHIISADSHSAVGIVTTYGFNKLIIGPWARRAEIVL
jgi:hypothetical protein